MLQFHAIDASHIVVPPQLKNLNIWRQTTLRRKITTIYPNEYVYLKSNGRTNYLFFWSKPHNQKICSVWWKHSLGLIYKEGFILDLRQIFPFPFGRYQLSRPFSCYNSTETKVALLVQSGTDNLNFGLPPLLGTHQPMSYISVFLVNSLRFCLTLLTLFNHYSS